MCSINHFNTFKPNGIAYHYQLDRSVSVLRGVGYFFLILIRNNKLAETLIGLRSAASELGLHCLHTSCKKDARLIRVKRTCVDVFGENAQKHKPVWFLLLAYVPFSN